MSKYKNIYKCDKCCSVMNSYKSFIEKVFEQNKTDYTDHKSTIVEKRFRYKDSRYLMGKCDRYRPDQGFLKCMNVNCFYEITHEKYEELHPEIVIDEEITEEVEIEDPFTCSYCNRRIENSGAMGQHKKKCERIHTGAITEEELVIE